MLRNTMIALAATTALAAPAFSQDQNIVETAQAAGGFETLLAAATAAGLAETLSTGEYTVFAPTDEAFAALPEGTVENLLLEENRQQLTDILLYHVVPGTVMSTDLTDDMEAATALEGRSVLIDLDDGVRVGPATVVQADIEASNGVIHVIDTVLLPE
ncbi:fasciclin domain-containing protein [Jannaschia sp. Os4]|uniref:fasciclin domain-containing protein n=1 Tax=Jannaschia sp. Os4 TaxID=2807617 RepID=UPI001939B68D|nr:fasciclin domain-containing protein [Jannaschia sp. Os4]MBM2575846.1 fasciclin domain-containing protein [Jannaschia sp. Os4]